MSTKQAYKPFFFETVKRGCNFSVSLSRAGRIHDGSGIIVYFVAAKIKTKRPMLHDDCSLSHPHSVITLLPSFSNPLKRQKRRMAVCFLRPFSVFFLRHTGSTSSPFVLLPRSDHAAYKEKEKKRGRKERFTRHSDRFPPSKRKKTQNEVGAIFFSRLLRFSLMLLHQGCFLPS